MLIQSHIYLAKSISSRLAINISQNHFYLGNLAPDFLYQHKKRNHEFKYSLNYIMEEINNLEKEEDIDWLSYKTGIITHYLADFFCKAHNCEYLINNLWDHFQYELLLHKVLISSKPEIKLNKTISNLEDYLKSSYENYLSKRPSVVLDTLYSLEVCQNISYYILNKERLLSLREIA